MKLMPFASVVFVSSRGGVTRLSVSVAMFEEGETNPKPVGDAPTLALSVLRKLLPDWTSFFFSVFGIMGQKIECG